MAMHAGLVDNNPTLVALVDERGRRSCAHLESRFAVTYRDFAGTTALDAAPHLLVDVDLTQVANVRRLRALLSGRRTGRFQAFAVDWSRRVEVVHANVLGATELIRRPIGADELGTRLARFLAPREPSHGHSVLATRSIATAAGALGEMFSSVLTGDELDEAAITAAGSEVVDAIGELGFSDWLDDVRRHHHGTFQHCLIVTGVISTFARGTGMNSSDVGMLTTAGMLHDIGKAAIPVEILDKPGKLTCADIAEIRRHPEIGHAYLAVNGATPSDVLLAVRHHHEMLDGSGYPDGLGAAAIGDLTRIMTVCDIYGALIEQRAYKPPMTPTAAMSVLEQMAGAGKLETALVRALGRAVIG